MSHTATGIERASCDAHERNASHMHEEFLGTKLTSAIGVQLDRASNAGVATLSDRTRHRRYGMEMAASKYIESLGAS
eukprot:3078586-Alexandrium_andersonii.AAC.1